MGGPLKLKFANHFIIYQNCPLRGHFGTGRLHSQLWDWGVKIFSLVSIDLSSNEFGTSESEGQVN